MRINLKLNGFTVGLTAVITSVYAWIVARALGFDGIDFNGDSHVYYTMSRHFLDSVSGGQIPELAHWPYGYPAVVSLFLFLFEDAYESAQIANIMLGSGVVCVLMWLSTTLDPMPQQRLFGISVPLILTALLWVGHGTLLKYQVMIMSDVSALLWSVLAMALIWKWRSGGKDGLLFLSGAALGLAICTRYASVLLLIPMVIALIGQRIDRHRAVQMVKLGLGVFAATWPQLLVFAASDGGVSNYELATTWHPFNFFSLTLESTDGTQLVRIPNLLYYFLLPFRFEDFTPLMIPLFVWGIVVARKRLQGWLFASVSSWYLSFYFLLCGIALQNPRIGFCLYAPIFIFILIGALDLMVEMSTKRVVFFGLLAAAGIAWFAGFVNVKEMVSNKDSVRTIANQVALSAGESSRVISTSLYAIFLAYPQNIEPVSIYQVDSVRLSEMLSDGRPTYLAINELWFLPQWEKYAPAQTYQWLRNRPEARLIGREGDYTLYQIQ